MVLAGATLPRPFKWCTWYLFGPARICWSCQDVLATHVLYTSTIATNLQVLVLPVHLLLLQLLLLRRRPQMLQLLVQRLRRRPTARRLAADGRRVPAVAGRVIRQGVCNRGRCITSCRPWRRGRGCSWWWCGGAAAARLILRRSHWLLLLPMLLLGRVRRLLLLGWPR